MYRELTLPSVGLEEQGKQKALRPRDARGVSGEGVAMGRAGPIHRASGRAGASEHHAEVSARVIWQACMLSLLSPHVATLAACCG
jgi:hypothetical protein